MSKITVIIPTYRRPRDLARCLEALKSQTRPAEEVLVVVRDTDAETSAFLEIFNPEPLPLRRQTVSEAGVVAAMNKGLDAATGEFIAFTDDDAAPHPDWLERIESHFLSDPRVGAVGGRDHIRNGSQLQLGQESQIVGRVQWFGRIVGNHHLGIGGVREVDVLKGVNMSLRRAALGNLRFDLRMRGTGAQVHYELVLSLGLKRAGWTLIYDPLTAVDHYPAQRFDLDQRDQFNPAALVDAAHNETLALLDYFPPMQRLIFLGWALMLGTRSKPGLLQYLRFWPRQGQLARHKWRAVLQGRWQGWQTWQGCRPQSATAGLELSQPPLTFLSPPMGKGG